MVHTLGPDTLRGPGALAAGLSRLSIALLGGALMLAGACGGDSVQTFPGGDTGRTDTGIGACEPSCFFKTCGDDGCGGTCGTCGAGSTCESFRCVAGDGAITDPTDASGTGNRADYTLSVSP